MTSAISLIDTTVRTLAAPVAGGILVNQLDELFMDANYFLRGLHRRERREVTIEALRAAPARRIAILIPAWRESEVIEQMLEHNLASLDYDPSAYTFFCGTYPNDPETGRKASAVARRSTRVRNVVVPHDGPTSKADCLNWVWQGILLAEEELGQRYDILLMHDAEDVIHPLSLRLYSYLIPPHDFVQTPVFSLEVSLRQLVAGTYIDEFSEHHLKDMLVRERIGGLIPSAGVGSAFSRQAFDEIAKAHGQKPFNTESLTEDYEIGLKFRLAGKKVSFACRTLVRSEPKALPGRAPKPVVQEEYIATREYFPDEMRASVRQRSRWILGITLQTWQQIGWKGTLAVLYCLWRDRKALFTNMLLLAAYLLVVLSGVRLAWAEAHHEVTFDLGALFPRGGAAWWLLQANLFFLLWRGLVKGYLVRRLYGTAHGFLSIPRLVVANVISLGATFRAVYMYVKHRLTKEPLRWLKTTHAFPSLDLLRDKARRLGEFLVAREGLAQADLDEALTLERAVGRPLGEVLVASGGVPARKVTHALGQLLDLPVIDPDPTSIPLSLLRRLTESEAERLCVLPVVAEANGVLVASVGALPTGDVSALERQLGEPVRLALAAPSALRRARQRAYRRLLWEDDAAPASPPERLGERLVARGLVAAEHVAAALAVQTETGEMLGEILVRQGRLPPEALEALFAERGLAYRGIAAGEGDPGAVARVGTGFCALHGIVPLVRRAAMGPREVASAHPLHEVTRAALERRLGEPVRLVLAPRLSVRIALSIAGRNAADGALGRAIGDRLIDSAELRAIRTELPREPLAALCEAARGAARSPIDELEARGVVDGRAAARLRARALGIPAIDAAAGAEVSSAAQEVLVPPGLARDGGVTVRAAGPAALVLAARRPGPRLAAQIASLYPAHAIAWQVAAPARGETS